MRFKGLSIGVPREIMPGERRVAAIPETVTKFVEAGARVLVERSAGRGSFFEDELYSREGAEIAPGPVEVYGQADIVVKIKEPQFNGEIGKHEAELLRPGSALVCFLHPSHPLNHSVVKTLSSRGITSFTLDSIPRISRAQQMDALTSMSTVAGYKAVITAAYNMARFVPMMSTAGGVIRPAEFIVVGTGVAGLQAAATAKRLGASLKTLDIRPEANEQARSLGAEIIPFDIPPEIAVGPGGYAKQLTEEWRMKEREVLLPNLADCEALILTALVPGEVAPALITQPMVETMKRGSVIIDIAVDQGGNCSLTKAGEEYRHKDVFISGLRNIPATLQVDSTRMFVNNAWHFLCHIVREGKVFSDTSDEVVKETLVTKNGSILHKGALSAMGENVQ